MKNNEDFGFSGGNAGLTGMGPNFSTQKKVKGEHGIGHSNSNSALKHLPAEGADQ